MPKGPFENDVITRGRGGGGLKMTKLLMLIFQSSFIKPSLDTCLITVPGCKGLSTMVRRPTYAVLSRNQFCRELRAHGRGVAKK